MLGQRTSPRKQVRPFALKNFARPWITRLCEHENWSGNFQKINVFQLCTKSTRESSIIQGSVWSRYNYTTQAPIAYRNLQ